MKYSFAEQLFDMVTTPAEEFLKDITIKVINATVTEKDAKHVKPFETLTSSQFSLKVMDYSCINFRVLTDPAW